jgi:hypothetical protein
VLSINNGRRPAIAANNAADMPATPAPATTTSNASPSEKLDNFVGAIGHSEIWLGWINQAVEQSFNTETVPASIVDGTGEAGHPDLNRATALCIVGIAHGGTRLIINLVSVQRLIS